MANGHGGPRTPHNPAPVSGPGKLARRTDGGPSQKIMVPTDQPYGDREALVNQEKSAGMAQSPSVAPADVAAAGPPQAPPYGGGAFNAPTARPGEPITHGSDIGPGAGPEALGVAPPGQKPSGQLTQMLSQMSATDTTGTLARLYEIAAQRGV